MKKHLIILLAFCCPLIIYSQNGWNQSGDVTSTSDKVGIGTTSPKSNLHVVGDLVLGTDQSNKKFVFHSRTNGGGDFLQITNDNQNGAWDWRQGILLYRGGNVSLGTYDHEAKLTVAGGPIKIVDGTQGAGKVLTSDSKGKASWQTPAGSPTLAVGDRYAGGIIFYLDETGEHGLVVTEEDVSEGIAWSNGTNRVTNATSKGIYGGYMNTALIIGLQTVDNPAGTFAALQCLNLSIVDDSGVEYGDWYLPSNKEWDLLDSGSAESYGIPFHAVYWSSTEGNESDAFQRWVGEGWDWAAKTTTNRVRAVRKF